MKNIKFKAFTLAETLITLGIIGIVASMTIPTLVNNYQKTQYVAAFKKAYTVTSQAMKALAANYNCIDDLRCTGLFVKGNSDSTVGAEVVKVFKTIKVCGTTNKSECFPYFSEYYDGSGTVYNPEAFYPGGYGYAFMTADGASYIIHNYAGNLVDNTNCPDIKFIDPSSTDNRSICANLLVDINGLKGPNRSGRDIFNLQIGHDRVYPLPASNSCIPTGGQAYYGAYCGDRIIKEGWQMNY